MFRGRTQANIPIISSGRSGYPFPEGNREKLTKMTKALLNQIAEKSSKTTEILSKIKSEIQKDK